MGLEVRLDMSKSKFLFCVLPSVLSVLFPMSENSKTQHLYNVTDFLLYGSRKNNQCNAFVLNVQDDIFINVLHGNSERSVILN